MHHDVRSSGACGFKASEHDINRGIRNYERESEIRKTVHEEDLAFLSFKFYVCFLLPIMQYQLEDITIFDLLYPVKRDVREHDL